jgi:hypothetical protein
LDEDRPFLYGRDHRWLRSDRRRPGGRLGNRIAWAPSRQRVHRSFEIGGKPFLGAQLRDYFSGERLLSRILACEKFHIVGVLRPLRASAFIRNSVLVATTIDAVLVTSVDQSAQANNSRQGEPGEEFEQGFAFVCGHRHTVPRSAQGGHHWHEGLAGSRWPVGC